jgi:hypothetical protein
MPRKHHGSRSNLTGKLSLVTRAGLFKAFLFLLPVCTAILACPDVAAADNPFGWDLSYKTLFKRARVPNNDTVAIFFTSRRPKNAKPDYSFPQELFSDIKRDEVQTAILIDYQSFWYLGHRMVSLYIRKPDSAYVDLYETKSGKVRRRMLELERFDRMSKALASMQQAKPTNEHKFKAPEGYVFSGYVGVLSQYRNGQTTQFLLTPEDLLRRDMSPGRVTKTVNPAMGIP